MSKHLGIAFIPLLLVATLTGCNVATQEATDDLHPKVEGVVNKMLLETENGSINLKPSTNGEFAVEVQLRARATTHSEAEHLLDLIETETSNESGILKVKINQPDSLFTSNTQASITVYVPQDWEGEYSATTVNGAISSKHVDGKGRLKTTNGNIEVEDASGTIDAQTTNGGISTQETILKGFSSMMTTNGTIEANLLTAPTDTLLMGTTNGSITMGMPRTANADLDVSVTSGSIRVQGFGEDKTARHDLFMNLNGGGPSLKMRTTSGSVTIKGQ